MRIILFLLFLGLLPNCLSAQIEDARGIFRELKRLEGVWFMPTDRGDRLEMWSVANDSTLIGRHVRIRIETGDTVTLENMRLELRLDSISYIAIVRGQNDNKPVVFGLTTADMEGYLFENPQHDDPKKIRYLLLGNRELQVNTEGLRGSRTVTQEFVFEREFNPSAVQFRIRAGMNVFTLKSTGTFIDNVKPAIAPRPGWELGTTFAFKGRGGYITLNVDLGLIGKDAHVKSDFWNPYEKTATGADTAIYYIRDVNYRSAWLALAVYPELTFRRDGGFSAFAGPYVSRLILTRTSGTEEPKVSESGYAANNDFKKTDIGLLFGLQQKLNIGKKDMDGKIGLRASMGLANVDNLYTRNSNLPTFHNGSLAFNGISLYYSVNLMKL